MLDVRRQASDSGQWQVFPGFRTWCAFGQIGFSFSGLFRIQLIQSLVEARSQQFILPFRKLKKVLIDNLNNGTDIKNNDNLINEFISVNPDYYQGYVLAANYFYDIKK